MRILKHSNGPPARDCDGRQYNVPSNYLLSRLGKRFNLQEAKKYMAW